MGKRWKKPPVRPEVRREWLRRCEEEGESPPQIASKEKFDVRTVRTQIELARQEREVREARVIVFRNALQSHYQDLCHFANELDHAIAGESTISVLLRGDLMWTALKQHLPRSPLWRKFDRWDHVLQEISKVEDGIRNQLKEEIERDSRLNGPIATGETEFIPGMVEALVFQTKNWARGREGLNITDNFKAKSAGEGYANVEYGAFHMNKVRDEHIAPIREALNDFESKITGREYYEDMRGLFKELERLQLDLSDELSIIIRKRVVPGRCKYCPM